MTMGIRLFLGFSLLTLLAAWPTKVSQAEIMCGQTITQDTLLTEDLHCPTEPGRTAAIRVEGSNITLDLGGHTLSGSTGSDGISVGNSEGVVITNGVIEGFTDGVFVYFSQGVIIEDLLVKNLDVSAPDQFIVGVHIEGSQHVTVRDSQFEFLSVAHKEAVDSYTSDVLVDTIEVRGGGAGVGFSFAGVCDPLAAPNTGTVTNSRFSDIYVAGFYIACGINIRIEGNDISTVAGDGIGLQVEQPHPNAVVNLDFTGNTVHDAVIGIELRGSLTATVHNNTIFDHSYLGVWVRHSLGCIAPAEGWECFESTSNTITNNNTWGSGTDLYHEEGSTGNTWLGNTCQTKQGTEIPECLPPDAALTINYASGQPGSYFTLKGANFPASSAAAVAINGVEMGTLATDIDGDLVFLLNTDQADPGPYTISASVNPSANAWLTLDPGKPLRPQEGEGPILYVPSGLVQRVFLPVIHRH